MWGQPPRLSDRAKLDGLSPPYNSAVILSKAKDLCTRLQCRLRRLKQSPVSIPSIFWQLYSFDPTSISRLVISTNPRICVHSDTIFPTTWPHLLFGSIARKASTHAA